MSQRAEAEPQPLWRPDAKRLANSQMTRFQHHVETAYHLSFLDYAELHAWSIAHIDDFWSAIWDFCEVRATTPYQRVSEGLSRFPGTHWFPGSRLNFAENLLRFSNQQVALVGLLETGARRTYTYAELHSEVERLASAMRRHGIVAGDRIVGLLPNIPEAVIAMLASASIGAIWSSCSPDFGTRGACERFGQIQPRLLFTTDAYLYNGKVIDCRKKNQAILAQIESIECAIIVEHVDAPSAPRAPVGVGSPGVTPALPYRSFVEGPVTSLIFEALPFDHPLYIMYSSGTTGAPKCIVHSAGGTLIQHLKEHKLHTDLTPKDTLFYFTTCSWMMWNWLVSGLTCGATLVLYDGSPFANNGTVLLDAIDSEQITVFGTSARYIAALEKQGLQPRSSHQLDSVKTVLATGSPLSESSYEYIYRDFKADVCLSSISGGTDIISCFMLGNPNLPVFSGEIQCLGLGMAVEFRDNQSASGENITGELVCTKPFPSTPLGFWQDPGDQRFHEAYFAAHPGVWTHGDYGWLTQRGGVVIEGRSDAVLNPAGVRIGTAEIYRQVETLQQVVDCIAVGQQWQGDERVVLFVQLQEGLPLTDKLKNEIRETIRHNTTPRHVPAIILQVTDIPRTISGKIVELAVRAAIHGDAITNTDALANPGALDQFRGRPELDP